MRKALIILHASPDSPCGRASKAVRLAAAMVADGKEVTLFLVEEGLRIADAPRLPEDGCRALFSELLDIGILVYACGSSMRKLGWNDDTLPAGVQKGSMKALSSMVTEADETVPF